MPIGPTDCHSVAPHRLDLQRPDCLILRHRKSSPPSSPFPAGGTGTLAPKHGPRINALVAILPTDFQSRIPHPLDPLGLVSIHDAIMGPMNSVGLMESFPRAFLSVQGSDRAKFLHNLLSHDIKGLPPGQARQACLLDRQGKIRFAAIVHAFEEEMILELDPAFSEMAFEALHQYLISEKVELAPLSDRYRIIPLHGPLSGKLLTQIWPEVELPSISFSHSKGPPASGVRFIIRWDLFRMPGFHLWVEPRSEEAIRKNLWKAGQPLGLQTISPEFFEILRIEAGVPWPGKEITSKVILNELEREDLVSFTKGCYVGQEIVARIKYRAHPPRVLTGFILGGNTPPPLPAPIEVDAKEAGVITSAGFSQMTKQVIGLGFLKHGLHVTDVMVKTPSGQIPAQVTSLPFTSNR